MYVGWLMLSLIHMCSIMIISGVPYLKYRTLSILYLLQFSIRNEIGCVLILKIRFELKKRIIQICIYGQIEKFICK